MGNFEHSLWTKFIICFENLHEDIFIQYAERLEAFNENRFKEQSL